MPISQFSDSTLRRVLENWQIVGEAIGRTWETSPLTIAPVSTPGWSGAAVFQVTQESERLCLKGVGCDQINRDRLLELHRLIEHVVQLGCGFVPLPRADCRGHSVFEFDGHYWQLEPWIDGEPISDRLPDSSDLHVIGKALAQWHVAAATFVPSKPGEPWFASSPLGVPPAIRERFDRMKRLQIPAAVELTSRIPGSQLRDEAIRLIDHLQRDYDEVLVDLTHASATAVPLQPCIRDIWRPHVLMKNGSVQGIIDYHAARIDNPVTDISRLFGSLCGNDMDLWGVGIRSYDSIRPLSASERLLLPTYDRSGCFLGGHWWLEQLMRLPIELIIKNERHILERLRYFELRMRDRGYLKGQPAIVSRDGWNLGGSTEWKPRFRILGCDE